MGVQFTTGTIVSTATVVATIWSFLEATGKSKPYHAYRVGANISSESVREEMAETKIQPELWPTQEEFESAKARIKYDPGKHHFAVCGSSGSGKSSLINALRGLKNFEPGAASTGVYETTMSFTRYPDPHQEFPRSRFVWSEVPVAGTLLNVPGWLYFNEEGSSVFDLVILVYDVVSIPPWNLIIWQTTYYIHIAFHPNRCGHCTAL